MGTLAYIIIITAIVAAAWLLSRGLESPDQINKY